MIKQKTSLFFILPIAVLVAFFTNVSLGSVSIPLADTFTLLMSSGDNEVWHNILWNFRLPKAITAVLVGAGLSLCGLLMQTLFRNPLAGPFVLGISSGASLGVALLLLAGVSTGSFLVLGGLSSWLVVLAASLGAAVVLLLVLAVSIKVRDSMTLLIIGLMFGSLSGAIVGILQYYSTGEEIQVYLFWTFGSLGGLDWNEVFILCILCFLGIGLTVWLLKPLNSLLLSENYAVSMGVNLKNTRLSIILATSLLAGSITAFCGPIAFIGLAIPHMARMLFNTSDHRVLIPATILCGMMTMLVCDIIAQLPGSEHILPINAITSLIGAPVVIWIVIGKGSVKKAFAG